VGRAKGGGAKERGDNTFGKASKNFRIEGGSKGDGRGSAEGTWGDIPQKKYRNSARKARESIEDDWGPMGRQTNEGKDCAKEGREWQKIGWRIHK